VIRDAAPRDEGLAVQRARDGDAEAFRLIFELHAPAVRRFLGDLLRDRPAADEATQETFVRAHARLKSLREDEKLGAWLFGIARMVSLESHRARRFEVVPEDGESAPAGGPIDPERLLLSAEAHQAYQRALEVLAADRRAALLLRVDHGLGYDEVAGVMGWTLPKVKNEIHRARLQLREALSGYLPEAS